MGVVVRGMVPGGHPFLTMWTDRHTELKILHSLIRRTWSVIMPLFDFVMKSGKRLLRQTISEYCMQCDTSFLS